MSSNYEYLCAQAYQLYTLRDYQRALETYSQLVKMNPNEYSFYHMIGLCYYDCGKYAEALPYFDEALRLNPSYEDSYYMKGSILYARGNFPEADMCYDKALEIKANHFLSYYQKGNIQHYYYHDSQEAIKCYDKAILINNNYAPSYTQKGLAHKELGQFQEAVTCLNIALKLNPSDFSTNYALGSTYYYMEYFEESLPYLEAAMRLNPGDYTSYTTLGLSLLALGRLDQALQNFLTVVKLNPSYSDIYISIGLIYYKQARYQDSLIYYDKAIQYDPNNYLAYSNQASALEMLGRHEDAIKNFTISIEKNPKNPLAYCNRAKCKQRLGRDNEALEDLNIAYKLFQNRDGLKDLQSVHLKYITSVLENDRQELLNSVQELNQEISHIETTFGDDPEARKKTEKLRTHFSKQLGKTISLITDEAQENKNEDYSQLAQQLKELQLEIKKLKDDIRDSGASEKAMIKREYDKLEKEDIKLYDYCKTFYWTLLNYIAAYRALSTGMFQANNDFDDSTKETVISQGLSKIAGVATSIAKNIPFAGSIISGIDNVISHLYAYYKQRSMQAKINIITSLVIEKSISEEDLSIKIAKTAIAVTRSKTNAILMAGEGEMPRGKLGKLNDSVTFMINKVEKDVKEVKEIYDTDAKKLALTDVIVLLAYLYKNADKMPQKMELDEQFKSIIAYGGYDSMVEGGFEEDFVQKKNKATSDDASGSCRISCSIF